MTGKQKHKAQARKPNRSRITSSMSYDEQTAMIRYGIKSETEWYALPYDERARKIAYIMATNLIESITHYEAAHAKS